MTLDKSKINTELQDEQDDIKWREIIATVDLDGDGKVSFFEFEKALQTFVDSQYEGN